jgi:hypothetical protein
LKKLKVAALQTANEEVLVSLIEINSLIVASKEVTLAMRFAILAAIAGLASEIGGLSILCGNIEGSVLYNRAVVRNQSSIIQRVMRNLISDAKTQIIQELTDQITASKTELSKQIQDFVDADAKYKEELDKTLSELPDKTAIETSLHVVGESYYRWDSVTTYFPTVTFLFREIGDTTYPRRSQIKVRLRQRNEELTELDIEKLKVSCQAVSTLRYTYGNTKINYVSSDKRFKTTMFAQDAPMAISILQNICDVIEEPFLERNISLIIGRIQ